MTNIRQQNKPNNVCLSGKEKFYFKVFMTYDDTSGPQWDLSAGTKRDKGG